MFFVWTYQKRPESHTHISAHFQAHFLQQEPWIHQQYVKGVVTVPPSGHGEKKVGEHLYPCQLTLKQPHWLTVI